MALAPSGTNRRTFLKRGAAGAAAASAVGAITWAPGAQAAVSETLFINQGGVEMIEGATLWVRSFSREDGRAQVPSPKLQVIEGEQVSLTVHNRLGTQQSFTIDGVIDETIAPNSSKTIEFAAPPAGSYIYKDREMVSRLLGMAGGLISMPADATGVPFVPFPGSQEVFKQYTWVTQDLSWDWGERMRRGEDVSRLTIDDFVPDYFLINGLAGHESLLSTDNHIEGKMGQPILVRILNTGVATHAMHFHGNHLYLLRENGKPPRAPFLQDTFMMTGDDTKDVFLPCMPPPDIWPPLEEWDSPAPEIGRVVAPRLDFPMHCHAEMSQSAAGILYPEGMLSHWHMEA